MSGHTPGKWLIEPGDSGDESVGLGPTRPFIYAEFVGRDGVEQSVVICDLSEPTYGVDPDPGDEYDTGERYHGSLEANARLIASAPALAEEVARLRALLADLEWSGDTVVRQCPECQGYNPDHLSDCRLKAALEAKPCSTA